MKKNFFLLVLFGLIISVVFVLIAYQHRYGIKERINIFAYYHINNVPPKLYRNDVFSFVRAKENPTAEHQGITFYKDYVYVTYPEDEGNGVGVIQKYTVDGHLVKSYANAPVGHSSNCCVVDGKLYVMKKKELKYKHKIIIFDIEKEKFDSCEIEFPKKCVLEGFCNKKDTLVMIAMNGSGHTFYDAKTSNKAQPDSIFFFYAKNDKILKMRSISVKYNFDYFTSQGVCATDSAFYILSSSYLKDKTQPKSYIHGMDCIITKIPYSSMKPLVVRPPRYIIPKPEGAFFDKSLGNNIYTSTSDSILFSINMF